MISPKINERFIVTSHGRRYELDEEIGSGGNGVVYRCYDVANGEAFAAKILNTTKQNRMRRFDQEIAVLQMLDHQHVIRCFGSGRMVAEFVGTRGTYRKEIPFCILELADCNLIKHLELNEWRIPYEQYIAQFRGLASALADLHRHAIHRDIKPENILVVGEKWTLADLGLCAPNEAMLPAITYHDEPIGPKFFMSPEAVNRVVCKRGEIVAASDIFQIASVFWTVINRSHPTGIVTRGDWHGPEGLFELLASCLAHDASARPANGGIFRDRLETAVDQMAS